MVKDLLVLFQAGNEGIINLLGESSRLAPTSFRFHPLLLLSKLLLTFTHFGSKEHYFEMEHKQAADALTLYKSFCTQTKKVVEYLKYAKELNNIIDVPIPNLKHVRFISILFLELLGSLDRMKVTKARD